jgi:peptide/nickel transport system substrate-binding protein
MHARAILAARKILPRISGGRLPAPGHRARVAGTVLAVTAVVLTAMGPLAAPPDAVAQLRREVRVGAAGVPASLEPATALEGTVPLLARHVFDTLVAYRERSTDVEPALASRWAVSRDGLTWTFTLRDGVQFSDSAPLTAAEVVASFERLLRADAAARPGVWAALLRGLPGVVKDVRAADARTVQFVLAQPYAALLTVLAHPGLSVTRPSTGADGVPRLVGTGPYRVVDASPGRLALEVAAGHWGPPPRAPRLVFLDVPSDERAEAELDAGTLDVWFPSGAPRRSEGALSLPGMRIGYLAFQTEKEPFSRRPLRRAVGAAMDPAAIGAAMGGHAVPLQSFLPPGTWGRREGSPVLGGTREQVRRLLTEGAWPRDQRPALLFPSDLGLDRLAEALQQSLGAADMPVVLRPEPADAVRTALQAGDHDLAIVETTIAGGDPHLLLFPLSTSEGAARGPRALNYSFYRNARLDDVLIRASQIGFRHERERLYQRAQHLLGEEMPWLPLYVRLHWAVTRAPVRGLRLHPTGFHRLTEVTLDPAAAPLP